MSYSQSTQEVVKKLEKKGFDVTEDPDNKTLLRCIQNGCKDILLKETGNGHMFKVATSYTTDINKALNIAGVNDLGGVA